MICHRFIPSRTRHQQRGSVLCALVGIGLVFSLAVPSLRADGPAKSLEKSSKEPKANYGRTPDSIIPYRAFRDPYLRFFQKALAFRGTGRTTETAKPCRTVRIGVLAPGASAPDADLGRRMREGIALAFEQANAEGGYRGTPFETVLRNDSGLWGSTANEMVSFKYHDDVLAVIGSIDGANTHVALRVALKEEIPMVNTATTDPTLTETGIPWIMRCMGDDRQQGYALAHHVFNECHLKKVAAFRANDRYGRTGIVEFRDAARRLKHPLRVELRWERGDREFGAQLDRIAQTDSQAVILWGNASDTAAIVRRMRRRHMPQRIFGCDRLVSRDFLQKAGDAAEGVVAVATYNPTLANPRYKVFYKAYSKRFGRAPDTFAAHAYDGANILIESIRKGGASRVGIRDALYEYRRYNGVTGLIEFDTTLNDIGPVYMATVKDGRFVYQRATFRRTAQAAVHPAPYRTLAEAPPVARVADVSGVNDEPKALRVGCFLPLDRRGRLAAAGLEMALAQDARSHPDRAPIELTVRDSRGAWGNDSNALSDLVTDENVLALVGSTRRRGTHLMETLAAKFHVPLITLCGDDPTIHTIPLPWVFSVASPQQILAPTFALRLGRRFPAEATKEAAMGYDAGKLLAQAIRHGKPTRVAVQQNLASGSWYRGVSGTFRFDPLGRRVDRIGSAQRNARQSSHVMIAKRVNKRGERSH